METAMVVNQLITTKFQLTKVLAFG